MSDLEEKIEAHLNTAPLAHSLTPLFCETLRWGAPTGLLSRQIPVGAPVGGTIALGPVAQLSGLPVFRVDWPDDRLPGITARRAVQRALKPVHAEHLLCYVTRDQRQAAFVWARKRGDDTIELRTLPYETGSPARTTIERLGELAFSLDELGDTGQPPITAVTDRLNRAFSVEAVTRQFYQEIANWYFWALDHARFPQDAPKQDGKDQVSLIRLITRVIFCWFLKEKGLIPATLFDPQRLSHILNGFAPDTPGDMQSVFYKAILQNLFFATLNTEMDKRAWAKDGQHFMAHSLYRFQELFRDPQAALALFKDIPFLNGGLFECLDRDEGTKEHPRYVRIDGFSRRPDSQPVVPDFLFFGEARTVDLSAAYGEARYRKAQVRGLVQTLSRYNFTLTENTPLDQEVALDPELLGKVFENLLAAYNPETSTTARKATGSYYTPREIVDYMVDEALIAALATRLKAAVPEAPDVDARLRHLFAYIEEPHRFSEAEVEALIHAIDHLKILDPACGSGAFPMGILHKLVFVLGKLDPDNERWRERQRQRAVEDTAEAFKSGDKAERERRLKEISDVFEENASDYGRKLYLIENGIYGVDIQPIAVQIAKLRCFISLIVDQKANPPAENFGIRALPNLETKFVAANVLIGLERPRQQSLRDPEIDRLERELARVREAHFTAKTPATKRKCRERDEELRARIAELLKHDGWDDRTARMLAAWDPYDQNASAPFFDAEWMFGVSEGFDVVIGNPPYVRIQTLNDTAPDLVRYLKNHYAAARKGNYDLYVVFVEAGLKLLSAHGELAFILPHKFFNAQYGQPLRTLLSEGRHLRHVVHFGDQQIFPGATNYVCLLFLSKAGVDQCRWVRVDNLAEWLTSQRALETTLPAARFTPAEWNVAVGSSSHLFDKLQQMPVKLGHIAERISQGIRTSANEVYVLDVQSERGSLITAYSKQLDREVVLERESVSGFLQGKEIKAYAIEPSGKVVLMPYQIGDGEAVLLSEKELAESMPKALAYFRANKDYLSAREGSRFKGLDWFQFGRKQNIELMLLPKILVPDIASRAAFAYDERGEFAFTSGYGITLKSEVQESPKYLLGLLNSRLLDWFWKRVSTPLRGGFYRYFTQFIAQLPIRPIDFRDASERAEHDAIVKLVERILAAKRADPNADTAAWEREIDERVYRLYGLTPDEIRIIEEPFERSAATAQDREA